MNFLPSKCIKTNSNCQFLLFRYAVLKLNLILSFEKQISESNNFIFLKGESGENLKKFLISGPFFPHQPYYPNSFLKS